MYHVYDFSCIILVAVLIIYNTLCKKSEKALEMFIKQNL